MRASMSQAPLPFVPLLLRREQAAIYLGMSPSTFDHEVKAGRMPKPIQTTNTLRAWHRGDLDAWAEDRRVECEVPGNPTHNPWDDA